MAKFFRKKSENSARPQLLLCDIQIKKLSAHISESPTTEYASDFDLSRSPKLNSDGAIGLPICDFLLVFDNLAQLGSLQAIRLPNLSGLEYDHSRSLNFKSDAPNIWFPFNMCLMFDSNI